MFIFLLDTHTHIERICYSFAKQERMKKLGARLSKTALDFVLIELPHDQRLTQKHGFTLSGVLITLVDSVGKYVTSILFNADHSALTDEFKPNLMASNGGRNNDLWPIHYVREHSNNTDR